MRTQLFGLALFFTLSATAQQFRFDNVTYQTVYPEDLCTALSNHPDYLFLDVRSNGEYYDTLSTSQGFNMGHLKNALHINITELPKRWKELIPYKEKPIFIYCSHSQRSRRASRFLADSGFINIFNVNGGMSRFIMTKNTWPDCFADIYETKVPYTIISPAELSDAYNTDSPYFIIDLRSDSTFKSITRNAKRNSTGKIKKAINIPFKEFNNSISKIPKDKKILLVDDYGDDSPIAAKELLKNGFSHVNILFGGMDEWMDYLMNFSNGNEKIWIDAEKKKTGTLISAIKFNTLAKAKNYCIIDIRKADQFNNQSKNYWENIGRIKTAVNIPFADIDTTSLLPASKAKTIVLYTFSDQGEVYEAAEKIKSKGYQNVLILYGGIWNLRWSAHNVKGSNFLKDWVVDIPAENQ